MASSTSSWYNSGEGSQLSYPVGEGGIKWLVKKLVSEAEDPGWLLH